MQFYQEVTEWPDGMANGIYLLNDDKTKMFAYIAPGQKEVKRFKNFIRIDSRGRKFKAVKNTFGYRIDAEDSGNPRWVVTGSNGDKYVVEQTENGLTCTCSGFKFRGDCKHVKQATMGSIT